MKPVWFTLLAFFAAFGLSATNYINEVFEGTFLPTGWTVDSHTSNWQQSTTAYAGGTSPEAKLSATPNFNGTTRLISPSLDVSGNTSLTLEFRYLADYNSSSFNIGAATRSAGGDWTSIWQQTVTGDTHACSVMLTLSADLTTDFQLCLYFSGSSANMNGFYLDNVRLYSPAQIDAGVYGIDLAQQYAPGATITPVATITNTGLTNQTFDVLCSAEAWDTAVYSSTQSVTLAAGASQDVTFDSFTPAIANEVYHVHVTTQLTGDMEDSNDTASTYFTTYTGTKQDVMVEIGTGTWCGYCPGAAMGADDMIENGLNAAIIEYHSGDSYETTESSSRISYYNMTGFPTAVFDGIYSVVGGNHTQSMYSSYLPYYQEEIDNIVPIAMQIGGSHDGDTYTVQAVVSRLGHLLGNENYTVFIALTESDIQVSWQGQDHLDFVERKMIPNVSGTAIDLSTARAVMVIGTFTMNSTWNADNCELVAFVQDITSGEIFQACKVAIPDMLPIYLAPTDLAYTLAGSGVTLTWTAPAGPEGLTGYKIYRDFVEVGNVDATTTSFTDHPAMTGDYYYYITAVYGTTESDPSDAMLIHVVSNGPSTGNETVTRLNGNYPNPFNPNTTISYSLQNREKVTLRIYDVRGRLVRTLISETQAAGNHNVLWNGRNNDGQPVASGVYFVNMTTRDTQLTQKIVMMK